MSQSSPPPPEQPERPRRPDRPTQNPAVVQLVNQALLSAIAEGVDQIDLHWRGDDFAITLQRGDTQTSEVPVPPQEIWGAIFDHIESLTSWSAPHSGQFRVGVGERVISCHVVSRHRALSHREMQLILEPES